ncbi:hypothetical protein HPB52_001256 [Rhipicephalus sanguineus]|uniref:Major facilitator superfamily (MFS) profile domain-containing protein n=1 Tax=Rhipicephalus sanguineus TaxID=34632 RepID=A0A9D4QFA7_RHISA|nr:hypothetical protein HPB52_001256 [Rhipicephalus sanguineus]
MCPRYGRKRALVFMTPLPILASVVICLSSSFLMLNVGRLVASLGLGGILNVTYTLSMEVLSARHRALGSLIATSGWTTGLLTMTGLAWLFRDWMIFQGVITIAATCSVVNWFFIPESPRWLLAMGKYDEARKELERADKLAAKPTFTELFRSRSIRFTSCLLSIKSVLDTLVYYNLTYSSILLGDPYLSFALVAAAEYPGRLLGVAAVNYLRRRTAYIALYSFASVCSAAAIFVPAVALARAVDRRVRTVLAQNTSVSPIEGVRFDGRSLGCRSLVVGDLGSVLWVSPLRLMFLQELASLTSYLIWPFVLAEDAQVDRQCLLALCSIRLFDDGHLAWLMASPAGILRVAFARDIRTLGSVGEASPADDDAGLQGSSEAILLARLRVSILEVDGRVS